MNFTLRNWSHRKWRPYKPDDITKLYTVRKNGCWIWKGTINKVYNLPVWKGYYMATRVLYERHVAKLGSRIILGRTCGNRLCVNPKHQVLSAVKRRNSKRK